MRLDLAWLAAVGIAATLLAFPMKADEWSKVDWSPIATIRVEQKIDALAARLAAIEAKLTPSVTVESPASTVPTTTSPVSPAAAVEWTTSSPSVQYECAGGVCRPAQSYSVRRGGLFGRRR